MSYYQYYQGKVYQGNDQADTQAKITKDNPNPMTGYNWGIKDYLVNKNFNEANQQITADETQQIADANAAQANTLNTAALASTRRQAGGTSFRRRGSASTPNALVSNLGTANAKALAEQRRQQAMQQAQYKTTRAGGLGVVGLGAPITLGLGSFTW